MSRSSRTKPDFYYNQSGVIAYRIKRGQMQVLLVRSSSDKRWVIPKGIIEPDLSPSASAAKEALEEAGVEGWVHPASVGSYQRRKWGGTCSVAVYLMAVETVHEEWAESYRRRRWVSVDEAAACVDDEGLKRLISRAPAERVSDRE